MSVCSGRKVWRAVGVLAAMVVGLGVGLPAWADGDGEPVEAQFLSTETVVLKNFLRGQDFILLADVTPTHVVGGHVALKVPCNSSGDTPLQVLVGSASEDGSNLVAVELERIDDLSSPGRDCVYHADLDIPEILEALEELAGLGANTNNEDGEHDEIQVTDIALKNSGFRAVRFGFDTANTATVNLLIAQ